MADGDSGGTPSEHGSKGLSVNIGGLPIPLRRTFGALDRLLAIPLEVLADTVERKIKRNLESHVEAVQKTRTRKGKKDKLSDPSVKTARTIAEWAAAASDVEPDENEMSAIWRSILDGILEGEEDAEDLIRVIKTIPRSELRRFIKKFAEGHWMFSFTEFQYGIRSFSWMERLTGAGLLQKRFDSASLFMLGAVGAGLLYMQSKIKTFLEMTSLPDNTKLEDAFFWDPISPLLALFFALMIVSILTVMSQMYRPTELGARLCKLYGEYRIKEK